VSIVKTPGVVGGRARVDGTRIPVWCIYNWMKRNTDAEIHDRYPTLKQEDLDDVRKYLASMETWQRLRRTFKIRMIR
jgi:uncharacterized protein (DUF433 family)